MKNEVLKADENIFEALEVANSGYEKIRLDLMLVIRKWFKSSGLNQQETILTKRSIVNSSYFVFRTALICGCVQQSAFAASCWLRPEFLNHFRITSIRSKRIFS